MTPEAALTKLAYVLSKEEWDMQTKREMMQTNLRGELTAGRPPHLEDLDLVEAVARSLKISSTTEYQELGSILFPAMLNAAVQSRDVIKLEALKTYVNIHNWYIFFFFNLIFYSNQYIRIYNIISQGADISQQNADGRTALHIACCEGDLNIVRCLLRMGANVHIKDRFNRTPLTDAIEFDHHEVSISLQRYIFCFRKEFQRIFHFNFPDY